MAASFIFTCMLAYALAQSPTPQTTTTAGTVIQSVVTLYIPKAVSINASNIQASVISADNMTQTAYALSWAATSAPALSLQLTSNSGSSLSTPQSSRFSADPMPPLNMTAGPSTLIIPLSSPSPNVTLQCTFSGAATSSAGKTRTTFKPPDSAVCQFRTAISGLGVAVSSMTLARRDITYLPVTITAGAEILASPTAQGENDTSAERGAGAAGPNVGTGLIGVVEIVVAVMVGLLGIL